LDKPSKKQLVLVAPIASAAGLDGGQRREVFARRRYAFMPLPGVPRIGDAYADLRLITPLERAYIDEQERVASMNDEGVQVLRESLVAFLTRMEVR
jgi:hypothetical protein